MMFSSLETYSKIKFVPKCIKHGCLCNEETKICKKCQNENIK